MATTTEVPPLSNLPPLHDSSNSQEHHKKHKKHPHKKNAHQHAKDHNKAHHGHFHSGHHKKNHHKKKHHHKKSHQQQDQQQPSPPRQRRLSASFKPVSWSDFAAVESRLTSEALQYVNDPKRVENLRKESVGAALEYLNNNSIWTLEEDKVLLRSRGFAIQEDYEIVQEKLLKLPSGKMRSFEEMMEREELLLNISGRYNGDEDGGGGGGKVNDDGTSKIQASSISVDNYVPSTNSKLNERMHLLFRGKLVMQDLMSEFLQKGTGYALNQGVKEENMLGVPLKLARYKEVEAEKDTKTEESMGTFSPPINMDTSATSPTKNSPNKMNQNMKKMHPDLLKAPSTPINDLTILVKSSGTGGNGQTISANSTKLKKSSLLIKACLDNNKTKTEQLLNQLNIASKKDSCVTYDKNAKTIFINGNSTELAEVYTHDMINKKIIEKYVHFSNDTKMMERADYLKSIKSLRLKHSKKLRMLTLEQIKLNQIKMKNKLRLHQEQEKNELREYLNEQMKAEIDAVIARHEQIKIAEYNHLANRQKDQESIIEEYYNKENVNVYTMGEPPIELPAIKLQREQQMEHVEKSISNVFGGTDVLVLMLLGSYLHNADLVASCIRSLAENRPEPEWLPNDDDDSKTNHLIEEINKKSPPLIEYLDSPGNFKNVFDSILVDDSMFVSLVQRLSTRALMALETKDETHTSVRLMQRVRRELKARRMMCKDSYAKLSSSQLKLLKTQTDLFISNLSKSNNNFFHDDLFSSSSSSSSSDGGEDNSNNSIINNNEPGDHFILKDINGEIVCDWFTPPFIDLVENEIIRRKKMSNVCFNSSTLPKTLSLSYDRMKVTLETPNRYASAQGTVSRSSSEFGKW
jgi:hypothetical protein